MEGGQRSLGLQGLMFPGHLGLDAVDLGDEVDLLAAATHDGRLAVYISMPESSPSNVPLVTPSSVHRAFGREPIIQRLLAAALHSPAPNVALPYRPPRCSWLRVGTGRCTR